MKVTLHLSLDDASPEWVASFEADDWSDFADGMATSITAVLTELGEPGRAVLDRIRDPLSPIAVSPDAARWSGHRPDDDNFCTACGQSFPCSVSAAEETR